MNGRNSVVSNPSDLDVRIMTTRSGPRLLSVVLALTLAACGPSLEPSVVQSPSPGEPAAETCPPINLVTPGGSRVDLTGTWRGEQAVHYVRQVGSCVWWIALSDYPGRELGAQYMVVFRGDIAADFTLTGEWMDVVFRPGISNQRRGFVTFDVATETVSGDETLVLRSTTTAEQGAGPYASVTLEYFGPLPAFELP
jgi:hypothetical protein